MSEKEVPQKRVKISLDMSKVIDTHFNEDLSQIKEGKLKSLFDEGTIRPKEKKSLTRLVKLLKQSDEGTIQLVIDYEKPKQTYTITVSLQNILQTHFDNDIQKINERVVNRLYIREKKLQKRNETHY